MVLTCSNMIQLGTKAAEFHLPDVTSGKIISLDTFADKKALLIMFICKHCPYVQHIKFELAKIGSDYLSQSLGIIAISSNDAEIHPDDSPNKLKEMANELNFSFPFCYDKSQEVAKAYQATCTPDFFLFNNERSLVYRGQLDDSSPGNTFPVDGHSLRAAIDSVLTDKLISQEQKASIGCNIKWKLGKEPEYFKSGKTSS